MAQTKGEGELQGLSEHEIITEIGKKVVDLEESKDEAGKVVEKGDKEAVLKSPVHCEQPDSDSVKPSDSGLTMSSALATEYKERAEAESIFWDAVALRQKRCKKRALRKFECKSSGQFSIADEFCRSHSNDSESKQDISFQLHNSACLDRSNPGNTSMNKLT